MCGKTPSGALRVQPRQGPIMIFGSALLPVFQHQPDNSLSELPEARSRLPDAFEA